MNPKTSTWLSQARKDANDQSPRWGPKRRTNPRDPKGNPQGTIHLPIGCDLEADAPIVLRKREKLFGHGALDEWGIIAADGYNGWMVASETDANNSYNGYFGTCIDDLFLDCSGTANGIEVGGAQGSHIRNVCIKRPRAYGIAIRNQSHSIVIDNIEIEGTSRENPVDVAVGMVGCKSITGIGGHIRHADTGLSIIECHGITWQGLKLERVNRIVSQGQANRITITDWQWPSSTPLDLSDDQGGSVITFTIRKAPSRLLTFFPPSGVASSLPFLPPASVGDRGNRPATFEVRTELFEGDVVATARRLA